jgi:hypothetical protein
MISAAISASLSAMRGNGDDRLAELPAVPGVGKPEFERVLGDAHGAAGGLDAGGLKRLHELLEALALDTAEQPVGRHLESLEADLVFLHAAVAQHLDLGARHALDGERVGVAAAGLGRQQHGQAAVSALARVGAHQHGHQVGADRMGDPGLVTSDLPHVVSRTARVASVARSDPVLGSVNTAVGSTSPEASRGSQCCFCSGVPPCNMSSAAISERVPREPTAM